MTRTSTTADTSTTTDTDADADTRVRGGRVAVVGALGLAVVALAAGPVFAKGGVSIAAPHTAKAGTTYTVSAQGDDDASSYVKVCLEQRKGGTWKPLTCGAVAARGGEARVVSHPRATKRGSEAYRAVVYGMTGPKDGHALRQRTSAPVTVTVR
ncbi:hypothetical protein ABT160_37095 [Streptomyces sp. NPDC001941]|uniref:hypothetical protein n=1 Tax=Streptomyces sp. NPDC001941 TaxID=3154659 RepID=UPI00331B8AC4